MVVWYAYATKLSSHFFFYSRPTIQVLYPQGLFGQTNMMLFIQIIHRLIYTWIAQEKWCGDWSDWRERPAGQPSRIVFMWFGIRKQGRWNVWIIFVIHTVVVFHIVLQFCVLYSFIIIITIGSRSAIPLASQTACRTRWPASHLIEKF